MAEQSRIITGRFPDRDHTKDADHLARSWREARATDAHR